MERRSTPADCRPRHHTESAQKLSRTFHVKPHTSKSRAYYDYSESNSDSEGLPDIDTIRSSDAIQREVDQRLADLRNPQSSGKCSEKIRSKREGMSTFWSKRGLHGHMRWYCQVVAGKEFLMTSYLSHSLCRVFAKI